MLTFQKTVHPGRFQTQREIGLGTDDVSLKNENTYTRGGNLKSELFGYTQHLEGVLMCNELCVLSFGQGFFFFSLTW